MAAQDRTIDEVAAELRVSRRTVDGWLATDLLRPVYDRRFQFHVRRGRKRLWTETGFRQLKAAIERESAAGGVLAGRSSRTEAGIGTPTVPCGPAGVQ